MSFYASGLPSYASAVVQHRIRQIGIIFNAILLLAVPLGCDVRRAQENGGKTAGALAEIEHWRSPLSSAPASQSWGKKKNVGVLEAAVEGVHCIKSCMWRSCLFTTYCVGQNGKYTPSTSQKQQSKGAVSKKNTLVRLSRGLGFSLFSRNAVFSWRKDWQTNRARQTLVFGRRVLKNQ